MNFSARTRAWLLLVSLLLGSSLTLGYTAHQTGASVTGAIIIGLGNALLGLHTALSKSPNQTKP